MKFIRLDRTELFNLLTVIATLILSGGDLLSLQIPEVIPEFGVPIILIVAVAVNYFSRSQVKEEAGLANARINAHIMEPFKSAVVDQDDDEDVYQWKAPPDYTPKVFILKKEMPGIRVGARFQQSFQSPNIYFFAIAISSSKPECDQVGIIRFEAQYVENNPEWFELEVEAQRLDEDK